MSDDKSTSDNIRGVSRRTFLMASAAVGGTAAFLGGVRRFPFQQAVFAADAAASPFGAAKQLAQPPEAWPCRPFEGTYYYVGPNEQFKSIQSAINHPAIKPGDTIFVRGGTYHEVVIVPPEKSGRVGAPLTITAYPGELPVIDGRAGHNPDDPDYPNDGFPKVGGHFTPAKDGKFYRWAGLVDITADHIVFEGFQIINSMGRGMRIYFHKEGPDYVPTQNVTIRSSRILSCRGPGLHIEGCSGVTIENCDVGHNCNFAPYNRDSGELNWPPGLGITGFQSDQGRIKSRNIAVRRTRIYENWGEGFLADNKDMAAEQISVCACEFWDNKAPSIYLHGVKDVLVEGNLLYRSSGNDHSCLDQTKSGSDPAACSGIAIAYTEPGPSNKPYELVNVEDLTIINNILVGFGNTNLVFFNPRHNEPEQGWFRRVKILSNTMIDAQLRSIHVHPRNFEDFEFKNNLIYQSTGSMIEGNFGSWQFAHNAWYPSIPDNISSAGGEVAGVKLVKPGAFRKAGEVNASWYKIFSNKDFKSPARGKALASSLVKTDYFGNRRKPKPDIGAHEFRYELRSWSPWRQMQFNAGWPWSLMRVGTNQNGRLEVIALDGDGTAWHAWQQAGGGWNKEWWPLYPREKQFNNLAVGANDDGRLEIFGVARDNSPWHAWQTGPNGTWNDWEPFHSASDTRWHKMVVGRNEDGRLEVFALAGDGFPWATWQQREAGAPPWHDWVQVSAWVDLSVTGKFEDLAVSSNQDGRLELFGLTEYGKIWHTWQYLPNNPPWCGWVELNPETDRQWQEITTAVNQDGRLEFFSIDKEGKVWHAWQQREANKPPWSEWQGLQFGSQKELVFKKLLATSNQDGRVELFGVSSTSGSVWRTRQKEPNGSWNFWQRLFKHTAHYHNLAVGPRPGLGLELFGLAGDGTMWHTWQKEG